MKHLRVLVDAIGGDGVRWFSRAQGGIGAEGAILSKDVLHRLGDGASEERLPVRDERLERGKPLREGQCTLLRCEQRCADTHEAAARVERRRCSSHERRDDDRNPAEGCVRGHAQRAGGHRLR